MTVAEGQVSTLTPGRYGDLTVSGSLVLNPGDYVFSTITIGHHATVAAAGTVRVMVADYLTADRGAQLHPLLDQPAGQLQVLVAGTGSDNLRGDSTATADVFLKNGGQFTRILKAKDAGSWDNGSVHKIELDIPGTVTLPTPTQALSGVRINLIQGGGGLESPDNWDITSLQVGLFNPGSEQLCQLNLVGTFELQDNSIGLVRLSESPGNSGVGPSSPIYPTGRNSGC